MCLLEKEELRGKSFHIARVAHKYYIHFCVLPLGPSMPSASVWEGGQLRLCRGKSPGRWGHSKESLKTQPVLARHQGPCLLKAGRSCICWSPVTWRVGEGIWLHLQPPTVSPSSSIRKPEAVAKRVGCTWGCPGRWIFCKEPRKANKTVAGVLVFSRL